MTKRVAVIIPFYKDQLTDYEKIALLQCERVLSAHPIIAIKPVSLTLPAEATTLVNFNDEVSFDDRYFKSLAGYNSLMLSSQFYGQFVDYDYILIYQMDCFVFKDELLYWCDRNFDYIGAPWIRKTYHKSFLGLLLVRAQQFFSRQFSNKSNPSPNKYELENKVGNGGFSLRSVKKFYDLCIIMQPLTDWYLAQDTNLYNEDVFWSIEVNRQENVMQIPSCQTGLRFAFEVPAVKLYELNEANLPFGCHDWDKYDDFWRPVFKRYGYHI